MLAHDPRVKETDVQELYQVLHPSAQGYSRCPLIHWNALRTSAVTGDPYVPKHELVDSPPLSPLQLYFKKWALERHASTPFPWRSQIEAAVRFMPDVPTALRLKDETTIA